MLGIRAMNGRLLLPKTLGESLDRVEFAFTLLQKCLKTWKWTLAMKCKRVANSDKRLFFATMTSFLPTISQWCSRVISFRGQKFLFYERPTISWITAPPAQMVNLITLLPPLSQNRKLDLGFVIANILLTFKDKMLKINFEYKIRIGLFGSIFFHRKS